MPYHGYASPLVRAGEPAAGERDAGESGRA
jgi:hypothetical protein